MIVSNVPGFNPVDPFLLRLFTPAFVLLVSEENSVTDPPGPDRDVVGVDLSVLTEAPSPTDSWRVHSIRGVGEVLRAIRRPECQAAG